MHYKNLLKIIGIIAFFIFGYFLYMKQLGAIPFLILSIILFYLGISMRSKKSKELHSFFTKNILKGVLKLA
ncbi:hypothetical protein HV419_06590 [Bacillus sporothermodurans]|uniref:hypothetical protein n=1 Tax=Heyndrickxia sporothermodurans TaxID=46224 RepID=UPI00192CDEC0|nr:hypothetical protein [Heyndrickxia sporothermodurans]MBL5810419.1 hypothetical protein [Heyndrickxia sporothermodurans]MBL5813976.1 hypothetical protein [Heyndrickxia sporothermodurans]MBL5843694.1 hypothetical protein [Heyndrickxia sporothermodurans]